MSGLREEKKKQNQINIIQSAKRIFTEKGFQNTSMTMIAKDAKVGTGTIYNYFPSKGSLLLSIFAEEVAQLEKDNDSLINDYSGDLVESITQLMTELTAFFDLYSKSFWREIMHAMTEEVEESIHLRRGLFGLDEEAMQWVKQIIEENANCFLIPVNSEEATNTVYGVVMMQTFIYIYDDSMTKEQFLQQLNQQIRFIFAGKLKD
ncbi:TetR/AcrR family transcriptional regulator [Virgibacillus ndiopensis]|uniref:TetR/AcrR family transcriptional regulator n=1 Tax=Virgibacillus ndiopensis TaxID=2004408 RepID=UPI000C06AA26|nr:TetR/AcrR family transcriptional regulator [Virgibacillus ndiopensis]